MVDKKLSEFPDITVADVAKLVCLYLDENNTIKNGKVDFPTLNALLVHKAGTETITGDKTFSGDTTFSGGATFNTDINANITGEAAKAAKDGDGNVISSTYGKLAGANTWTAANTYSSSVSLGSNATVTAPAATDSSTKVVNSQWVTNHRCTTKATTSSTASVNAPAYITQNYKSGTTWYRVWSDGWIEQGGRCPTGDSAATRTVTFPKAFTETNYTIQKTLSAYTGTDNVQYGFVSFGNLTKTTAQTRTHGGTAYWFAAGY